MRYIKMEITLLLLLVSIIDIHAQPASGNSKIFKAGASTSNITPPLGDGIVGNFGVPPPAAHIHDQLHARCLALDDGETRLVFVVVDNVGVNQEVFDQAKRLISETTGLPKQNMLMSSTHTHSATSAGGVGEKRRGYNKTGILDEYQTFLARRIADGVRVAMNNLEPARIGWGVGNVPQHVFNRRWKMKPGTPLPNPFGGQDKVLMNPGVGNSKLLEPAGPTDPQVSFLSVQSITGRPIALLANYSLHYVGGVPDDDISADYFGVFADRIQELLKADRQDPSFLAIMSNGTSGDVNNINVAGSVEKLPSYAKIKIVANDVAQEVLRVYKTIKHSNWVRLQAGQSLLPLTVRKPTPEMIAYANKILAKPENEAPIHKNEKAYASRTLQLDKEWPDKIEIILQAFSIGDLGIAAIPFETFTQTGLDIKAKSPFKTTFTIELANGNFGYLPTPEQHELGGYETWLGTNKVEKNASNKIVKELLNLFARFK
ncbi:MAG TPA: neutral/alkaline non-lysosomal ceramidase N-terminal domain-containing protein [Sphingobacteriaceae bacterium]|nr:neutral/alkaline non-lysosomal ceramidase N-terminal domain-containing protein [Sphingobacteriaceae bacterium]